MKKNNRILFLCLIIVSLVSCSTTEYWKLSLNISGNKKVDLERYDHMILTEFLVKKETEDFNINKEMSDYFSFEIEKLVKKTVTTEKKTATDETQFETPEYWTGMYPDEDDGLIMTGSIEYTEEVRKALIEKEKRRFEDPFPEESRLTERKFYTLNLQLFLIDGKTGDTVYKRNFKESKAYKNPRQTAYFAFFELVQNIKEKFLLDLLGGQRREQRYLIK